MIAPEKRDNLEFSWAGHSSLVVFGFVTMLMF